MIVYVITNEDGVPGMLLTVDEKLAEEARQNGEFVINSWDTEKQSVCSINFKLDEED